MFLDRDGVINRCRVVAGKPYPPQNEQEFEFLPGVRSACNALRRAGFLLIVVTNQPDVARGKQTLEVVQRLHERLERELPVRQIRMCPHDDADQCECRKPKPGMLLAAAAEHEIDLARSFMVGDRWKDIEAGRRAGCRTVWLQNPYDETKPSSPDLTVGSLAEAVIWMVQGFGAAGGNPS